MKKNGDIHFDPWGNVKNDANWLTFDSTTLSGNLAGTFRFSHGFTGHEHYADLKIINTNGRLYDPVIARFFSPDNFVQAPEFTQSYNRYSYCLNNPLQWVDPSGELFGDYFDQYGVFLGTDGIDDGKIHIIDRDLWNQIKDNISWVGNDGVRMISRDLASDQHGGIFSHKPSEANLPDESVVNIFEHYNQSAYPCIAMERGTSEKSDNGKVVGLTTDHIIKKIMVRIDGNTNFKIIDNYNEIINLLQHEQQHVEDRINKIYVTNSLSEKRAVLRQIQHPTFAKTRSSFQNATYEYGRKYGIKF